VFHKGSRLQGGDLPSEDNQNVTHLLDQFTNLLALEIKRRQLRRAIVRSMLPCSLVIILDNQTLWIAAEKQSGMPSTNTIDERQRSFPAQEIYNAARWEFGFEQPFIISFPVSILSLQPAQRAAAIQAIVQAHIESELQRVNAEMNTIQVNPIFGPASYQIDNRLAFVLMPFTPGLTEIYQSVVKPTIEANETGLVCKRADDIKSNRAIIQDIWKSICEARIIIADMTNLNPNVMYELGIAHTLGKETILIYQRTEQEIRFPFDLSHIRRIEYENTATGGRALEEELRQTLENVLAAKVGA
jgi:hypothetical protein